MIRYVVHFSHLILPSYIDWIFTVSSYTLTFQQTAICFRVCHEGTVVVAGFASRVIPHIETSILLPKAISLVGLSLSHYQQANNAVYRWDLSVDNGCTTTWNWQPSFTCLYLFIYIIENITLWWEQKGYFLRGLSLEFSWRDTINLCGSANVIYCLGKERGWHLMPSIYVYSPIEHLFSSTPLPLPLWSMNYVNNANDAPLHAFLTLCDEGRIDTTGGVCGARCTIPSPQLYCRHALNQGNVLYLNTYALNQGNVLY